MGLLSAIGGIIGAFGTKSAAKSETKAAEANAALIRERTSIETLLAQREGRRGIGATIAAFGASGVTLGGSASDVLRESRRDIAFQVSSIRSIGAQEAGLFDAKAKASKKAGKIGFAAGLLGAATSFFDPTSA